MGSQTEAIGRVRRVSQLQFPAMRGLVVDGPLVPEPNQAYHLHYSKEGEYAVDYARLNALFGVNDIFISGKMCRCELEFLIGGTFTLFHGAIGKVRGERQVEFMNPGRTFRARILRQLAWEEINAMCHASVLIPFTFVPLSLVRIGLEKLPLGPVDKHERDNTFYPQGIKG
jgi:hypothetical protein